MGDKVVYRLFQIIPCFLGGFLRSSAAAHIFGFISDHYRGRLCSFSRSSYCGRTPFFILLDSAFKRVDVVLELQQQLVPHSFCGIEFLLGALNMSND